MRSPATTAPDAGWSQVAGLEGRPSTLLSSAGSPRVALARVACRRWPRDVEPARVGRGGGRAGALTGVVALGDAPQIFARRLAVGHVASETAASASGLAAGGPRR